jgi:hypothetical protein
MFVLYMVSGWLCLYIQALWSLEVTAITIAAECYIEFQMEQPV